MQILDGDLDAWMSEKNENEREAFGRQACYLARLLDDENHENTKNIKDDIGFYNTGTFLIGEGHALIFYEVRKG